MALLLEILVTTYYVSNEIGKSVVSNVNFSYIPMYSIILILISVCFSSYFVAKNKTSKAYQNKLENFEFESIEDFISAASGKEHSRLHTDKIESLFDKEIEKGNLVASERES